MSQNKKTIFEYTDFREYLNEKWKILKQENPKFSLRYFARVAGFKSHNFLKHVLSGKSRLSEESIEKFAKALKLNREESLFFKNLVLFNQAVDSTEKHTYARELTQSKTYRKIFPLAEAQFNYFTHWYLIPIREFVKLPQFKEDYQWIAQSLTPKITPAEAEKAVEELLQLGLLERNSSGELSQKNAFISTANEVGSKVVAQYHREMLKRAAESIDLIPREKRDISNMTVTVSEEMATKLKEKIQNFRKEVIEMVAHDNKPNSVYQLNFQIFPIVFDLCAKGKK
ncbi:MAG: TIGR02147 family protein [Pseudobdellovibrionaceae bacterium]